MYDCSLVLGPAVADNSLPAGLYSTLTVSLGTIASNHPFVASIEVSGTFSPGTYGAGALTLDSTGTIGANQDGSWLCINNPAGKACPSSTPPLPGYKSPPCAGLSLTLTDVDPAPTAEIVATNTHGTFDVTMPVYQECGPEESASGAVTAHVVF